MLPVVGLAVLTSQLWDKKTSLYFLFGFFIMKYMEIDILFLAILAIFVAMRDVYNYLDNQRSVPQPVESVSELEEEEEFFR